MRALHNGAGLESALFGRMVTSDPAANTDAAIHVAHAFTVHGIERELDFMTVVDDLKDRETGDDPGAAGMFDMELASGLYYGYVVVDVPLLIDNLAGDREIAARVVEHLLHLVAQVSPGAKKGSTAPYAWAELMLIEAGARQPRTMANAFREAIDPRQTNRLLEAAVERIAAHLTKLDRGYGDHEARRVLNLSDIPIEGIEPLGLDRLAAWAALAVRAGEIQ
jgi:CRISPR system Cascade subunit CasC